MGKVGKLTMTVCMAAFLVPVFLAGCGKETDSAGSGTVSDGAYEKFEEVELRLSCNGTETANDAKAAYRIADKLSEKSGGRVTMTVFTNDQLSGGNMSKGLEMLCNGTVDLDIHSTSVISNLDNRLMVSTLPWLFSDYQEAEDAFYGEGGEYIDSILQEKGVYYLGAVHNGFKAITNSKHPIQKPEDLKGLKIRIPGGSFFSDFYSMLGASPQAMSWSEVFTALQQGTIDGHDNSLTTINSGNVQEVQKYITISKHTYEAFTVMANQKRFDVLNEDTQNLIRECVEEATKEINQEIIEEEATLEEKFTAENGCEIYELTEEDIADFKAAVLPLEEKYKELYGSNACAAFGAE